MNMFKVTNKNEFDFDARHHGTKYVFPSGKTVAVPEDAAVHIFGIGDKDKSVVLSRHGWALPTTGLKAGLQILEKFSFERMVPRIDVPFGAEPESEPALGLRDAAGNDADAPEPVARRGRLAA